MEMVFRASTMTEHVYILLRQMMSGATMLHDLYYTSYYYILNIFFFKSNYSEFYKILCTMSH